MRQGGELRDFARDLKTAASGFMLLLMGRQKGWENCAGTYTGRGCRLRLYQLQYSYQFSQPGGPQIKW
jgi:hypothetical protein